MTNSMNTRAERALEFVFLVAGLRTDGECEACGKTDGNACSDTCGSGYGYGDGCGGAIHRQSSEDAINALNELIAMARQINSGEPV